MPNYDPNGPKVRDVLFDSGLRNRVFVNKNNNCKPYIFLGKPTSAASRDSVKIGYVIRGLSEAAVYSSHTLADHLDDPLYNPHMIDANTPPDQIADMELVRQEILMRNF